MTDFLCSFIERLIFSPGIAIVPFFFKTVLVLGISFTSFFSSHHCFCPIPSHPAPDFIPVLPPSTWQPEMAKPASSPSQGDLSPWETFGSVWIHFGCPNWQGAGGCKSLASIKERPAMQLILFTIYRTAPQPHPCQPLTNVSSTRVQNPALALLQHQLYVFFNSPSAKFRHSSSELS